MTKLQWSGATDVGMIRSSNEDQILLADPIFAVADGMGGHQGGEVASLIAIKTLERAFAKSDSPKALTNAVAKANKAIWKKSQSIPQLNGMGTTLTAVARIHEKDKEQLAVINVGDSRAYLLRNGELKQITVDHSLVGEMVKAGQLTPEEAEHHPRRNVLTKALGVEAEVDSDYWIIDPKEQDRILICSDGLVREVSDSQIAATLRRLSDPNEVVRDLISQAKANGGNDNVTVVVIDVISDNNDNTKILEPPSGIGFENLDISDIEPTSKNSHDITFRVIIFVFALFLLLASAIAAIGYYERGSYFVGLRNQRVTIFKGRPDPVLWFKPTVVQQTKLTSREVLPARLDDLKAGKTEPTLSSARQYISNLIEEKQSAQNSSAGSSSTTLPTSTSVQAPVQ